MAIRGSVEGWRVRQAEAAKRLGITQPRLSDLLRGRLDKFSLDRVDRAGGCGGIGGADGGGCGWIRKMAGERSE